MLGDLVVNFMANARPFQQGVREVQQSARETVGQLREMVSSLPSLGEFATVGSLAGVFAFSQSMAREARPTRLAAEDFGLAVSTYRGYVHSAVIAGVGEESVKTGLAYLQRYISEATSGTALAGTKFKQLGLDIKELG